jgi:hypothetical protein
MLSAKKISKGLFLALGAATIMGAALVAQADDPVNLAVSAFSGFPTPNPQTRTLDGVGPVTASASASHGTIGVNYTGTKSFNWSVFNDCVGGPSPTVSANGVTGDVNKSSECGLWFFGNVNVTTHAYADAL